MRSDRWMLVVNVVRDLLLAAILACWAVTVQAAIVPVLVDDQDLLTIPWLRVLLGGVIAFWGGLARTVIAVADAKKNEVRIDVGAQMLRDIVVSSCIGFVVYGIASNYGWGKWQLGISLMLAGFAGAQFLPKLSRRWMRVFFDVEESRKGDL